MSKTEATEAALRLLNEGYARGLIPEEAYVREDARLRTRQAEIKAWREGQGRGGALYPVARAVSRHKEPAAPISPRPLESPPRATAGPLQGRLALRRAKPPDDRRHRLVLRRRVAASGMIPHQLAGHFTLGEQAVLTAIAYEVMRHGSCALTWGHIGARAGCGRDLVRRTVHKAAGLGLLSLEERPRAAYGWKHAPTIVWVLDPLWCRWIARRKEAEARKIPGGMNVPAQANGSKNRTGFLTKSMPRTPWESCSRGYRGRGGADGG